MSQRGSLIPKFSWKRGSLIPKFSWFLWTVLLIWKQLLLLSCFPKTPENHILEHVQSGLIKHSGPKFIHFRGRFFYSVDRGCPDIPRSRSQPLCGLLPPRTSKWFFFLVTGATSVFSGFDRCCTKSFLAVTISSPSRLNENEMIFWAPGVLRLYVEHTRISKTLAKQ